MEINGDKVHIPSSIERMRERELDSQVNGLFRSPHFIHKTSCIKFMKYLPVKMEICLGNKFTFRLHGKKKNKIKRI